jgi:hypothetical protein
MQTVGGVANRIDRTLPAKWPLTLEALLSAFEAEQMRLHQLKAPPKPFLSWQPLPQRLNGMGKKRQWFSVDLDLHDIGSESSIQNP